MEAAVNIVEYQGNRFYLFPYHLDWYWQSADKPVIENLEPKQYAIDYDFARNEFDHLLFCVTNRCNITCDYCFRGFNFKKTDEIDFENFKKIADHFHQHSQHNPTFQFTGGEVFVKKGIEDWFQYIHDLGFRIWMTTNGVSPKIRDLRIQEIFQNNPKVHVRISCDGHNAELFERHRGTPGTFKKVEDNIKYLVSIGAPTSIKTVMTPENIDYLEDIIEWAYELGCVGWNYNVLRYTGAMAETPPEDATCKSKGDIVYVGYVEIGRRITEILERKPYLAPMLGISRYGKILDTLYSSNPHGVPMSYYVMNYDGTVYYNDNLYEERYSGGNYWEKGLDAFDGLMAFRQEMDNDLDCCKRCPIHRFCFQKGDYGEYQQEFEKAQHSGAEFEFPNCDDIRKHFFDMMSLGTRGKALLKAINTFSDRFPKPI